MKTFKYKARTPDGSLINGVIEAYNEFEAVSQLRDRGLIVEKMTVIRVTGKRIKDLNEPLRISLKSLSMISGQFSLMLRAGMPIVRTVEMIAKQADDRMLKRILTDCYHAVASGISLAAALEQHREVPRAFVETVRAGENSGTLESAFQRLEAYYDKSSKVARKVRGALTYPIIVMILAAIVIGIIVAVLVPTLLDLFGSAGASLPWPTLLLMATSNFFSTWWPALLVALALTIIFLKVWGNTPKGGVMLASLRLRLPVLGKVAVLNTASQLANTMCTLLAAGLPAAQALSITARVVDNKLIGQALDRAVLGLEEGRRLGEVLEKVPHLPEMLISMTAIGEESGMLEDTMATMGLFYDEEAQNASNKALSLLEPALTIVLGAVIGFIVIAIYLPMMSMYNYAF